MINSVYIGSCPNCGGPLEATHALEGLPCSRCLPGNIEAFRGMAFRDKVKAVYNILVSRNSLKGYWELYYSFELYDEVISYFKKVTGNEPWSMQRFWLRRLAEGASFSMSAPTGLGKTTTIMVYSSYLGENVLYLVPTKSLQEQICSKLGKIAQVACGKVDEKKISVVTVNYLNRNFESIKGFRPKFIGVDDADAIVKSGKTTDKLVAIMGISQDVYEDAIKLVSLKRLVLLSEHKEDIEEKIRRIEAKIASFHGNVAQLVVASATMRPKGAKQKALKYITGFDVSTAQIYARNIIDAYYSGDFVNLVERLGEGGLVLVSREYGKQKMKELQQLLEDRGIRADLAISGRKFLERFSKGETSVIIGSASYYGVAVRGIDEPKRLKYVIFYGVPKSRVKAMEALYNPFTLLRVSKLLNVEVDENKILNLNSAESQALRIAFLKSQTLTGKLGEVQLYLKGKIEEVRERLKSLDGDLDGDSFVIRRAGRELYIEFPDPITYLQGSGRSSRLLNGGLTLGLSVVLVDELKLLWMLTKRLRYVMNSFEFVNFASLDLDKVKAEMEKSRMDSNTPVDVSTALMIVESPTKAKTISRLFGSPARRTIGGIPVYETVVVDGNKVYVLDVVATKGHLTDLTLEERGYYGVEVGNNRISPYYSPLFRCINCKRVISANVDKCPYCGSTTFTSSVSTVNALRKLAMEVDKVLIATDPDTEGEKIAYDVAVNVKGYNDNVFRIKYHEVTRKGILEALRNQGYLDLNAVHSQIVRRIEDRWLGFELSKALKLRFNSPNHGAGRVQTPVLGWIVERTKKYKASMGWIARVKLGDYVHSLFLDDKEKAKVTKVKVEKLEERVEVLSPLPPYTTDALLIDAYSYYKIPAERVMRIAQDLFELGLITYHRTDSIHVSSRGIEVAKEYLEKKGIGHFSPRSWGDEGTHEAIRPTYPVDVEELKKEISDNPNKFFVKLTWSHLAVYDLIFKRFIASQMENAIGKFAKYKITVNDNVVSEVEFLSEVTGGFSLVAKPRTHSLPLGELQPQYEVVRGSKERLLNYAEVIRLMREKNIGRPSTYAKTIQNLIRHGYVVQSKKRGYLIATKKGMEAFDYLSTNFPNLVSESTTSELVEKMDLIAKGSLAPEDVIFSILAQTTSIGLTQSNQEV
ncbi:MAG: reverse gyrase [Candidatus Aramenus sulfurataquae]|uniref:Reverse gyrase n=3 Tax=Candidatus Aramenus sulfurataquae TaxID=1326980 RepID=A0A0F2LQR2_9CREN|nr:reverse gyrase [Candidatus Aramenus sulfurataquae]